MSILPNLDRGVMVCGTLDFKTRVMRRLRKAIAAHEAGNRERALKELSMAYRLSLRA